MSDLPIIRSRRPDSKKEQHETDAKNFRASERGKKKEEKKKERKPW